MKKMPLFYHEAKNMV